MEKTLHFFAVLFIAAIGYAQDPVTISSNCETLNYHGTYTQISPTLFKKGFDCTTPTSEVDCVNIGNFHSFSIQWDTNNWILKENSGDASDCIWLIDACYYVANDPGEIVIATNSANTSLPPCSGWNFVTAPTCTPSFSNCTTLATDGFAFNNNIEIFPNPIENEFTIKSNGNNETLHVSILNSLGQIVLATVFSNSEEIKLNLNQPSGIYFAKITNSENQIAYSKLIKK